MPVTHVILLSLSDSVTHTVIILYLPSVPFFYNVVKEAIFLYGFRHNWALHKHTSDVVPPESACHGESRYDQVPAHHAESAVQGADRCHPRRRGGQRHQASIPETHIYDRNVNNVPFDVSHEVRCRLLLIISINYNYFQWWVRISSLPSARNPHVNWKFFRCQATKIPLPVDHLDVKRNPWVSFLMESPLFVLPT